MRSLRPARRLRKWTVPEYQIVTTIAPIQTHERSCIVWKHRSSLLYTTHEPSIANFRIASLQLDFGLKQIWRSLWGITDVKQIGHVFSNEVTFLDVAYLG